MTAIINGVQVTGTPDEINYLINLSKVKTTFTGGSTTARRKK